MTGFVVQGHILGYLIIIFFQSQKKIKKKCLHLSI